MIGLPLKNIKLTKEKPIVAVPVIAKDKDTIIDEICTLGKDKVQLIEWRLDYFMSCEDFASIQDILNICKKHLSKTLLLLTMRTKTEGGEYDIKGDALNNYYVNLSKLSGFELIDIQYNDSSKEVVRHCFDNKKYTILSYHNFEKTPSDEEMDALLNEMISFHSDILKFAFFPKNENDVQRTIEFSKRVRQNWHGRQILISMGELGKNLRLNPFLTGSCVTFGCKKGFESAPGQVEYHDLIENIASCQIKRNIIFLIGYMGTGKTTVGKELRKKLRFKLVDLDQLIEKNEGITIKEMMESFGEKYFRDIETKTLMSLKGAKKLVVSCGGGVILREENRQFMKENGVVVLLEASPEQIFERIKHDNTRPLLAGNMTVEYIAQMKSQRDPLYNDAAEIVVDTANLSRFDICDQICNAYGES